ncbi:putative FAD-dependent monooxygenase [Acrodontium crateriforme]|uniref:FAD-dependent monooxygenase n=1 Tax=Acrodontium crateriforme TaxID=150365 RepID=A0AAQ3M3F5_9PEZI|nr:putative FAD-dependent monooxygenase [Acrodontium crateriforme]
MSFNQDRPILIIGAGLAGLALAQGLKRSNIAFRIFERDPTASSRAQGYRIRINPDGAAALQSLLPSNLQEAFRTSSAPVIPGGSNVNALSGEISSGMFPPGAGPPFSTAGAPRPSANTEGTSYNADRFILRTLLMTGLEEIISFGKKFARYELLEHGGVAAHFEDGTSYEGTLVIGADGVHSAVRKQLLPEFRLFDSEGRAVFGKTNIYDGLLLETPESLQRGINLVGEGQQQPMKLFCDTMKFDRSNEKSLGALGLELPQDYIYWVLAFNVNRLSLSEQERLHHLSSEESAKQGEEIIAHWHQSIRTLLSKQERNAASTLTFLTSNPDAFSRPWNLGQAAGKVTLLGDAAHAMPPVGGVGANTAFQDAADLQQALVSENDASLGSLSPKILDFQEKMRLRAHEAVQRSAAGGGRFFGMKPIAELKPVAW